MPRLFIDTPLAVGQTLQLPDDSARHVQALRLREGDPVVLFNGSGGEYTATVAFSGRKVSASTQSFLADDRTPAHRFVLAQALLSADKMDWVIQKATELGVSEIAPFAAARSTIKLDDARAEKRLAHWQGVARAACEQCGMNRVPVVHPIAPLAAVARRAHDEGLNRLALAIGAQRAPHELPQAAAGSATLIVIGPEGDFSAEELTLLDHHGFARLGLGPRVLRTETAGIAAVSMLTAVWRLI
jgi:16S rRNA (uracil1498-N3)-methyltransferase